MSDSIGARVKKCREKRGFTQEQLATRCDLTGNYIGRLERGDYPNPTLATLEKLAKALEVTPVYLGYGEVAVVQRATEIRESGPAAYISQSIPEIPFSEEKRGILFDRRGQLLTPGGVRETYSFEALPDRHAYCLRVEVDSLEPFIKKGHRLICVTNREPVPGDYVSVQLRQGQCLVCELVSKDDFVLLKPLNPLDLPLLIHKKDVRSMHVVLWICRSTSHNPLQ